ncbi:hypothetical protein JYT87_00175 [Nitrospira defluvii]|nr:hypothetical protein [Nitrospira defluvii]
MKTYMRQYHDKALFPFVSIERVSIPLSIVLLLVLTGCNTKSVDEVIVLKKTPLESTIKEQVVTASPGNDSRAWIKSLAMTPLLPNKDQLLQAAIEWGPEGRPIEVSYQWFVNGVEIQSEQGRPERSNVLSLKRFRSGDRVYLTASLIRPDGSVAASRRSLSTVIQNRAPQFDSGLEGLTKEENDLRGRFSYSDPDGDLVVVKLLKGPEGLTVEEDGVVRWSLSKVEEGDHQMIVELVDERGLGFRGTLPFSIGVENEVDH